MVIGVAKLLLLVVFVFLGVDCCLEATVAFSAVHCLFWDYAGIDEPREEVC